MTAALEIEQLILRSLSDVVGPNFAQSLDPEMPFFNHGIDSLAAVRLMARLSELLDRYVSIDLIFDYPTPRALAEFLATRPSLAIPDRGQET
jgi:acyl carrier protein